MTQDEIIDIADKADEEADKVLNMKGEYHPNWHQVRDEIFAKLVATKEREACANLCWKNENDNAFINAYNGKRLDLLCSELIRARGKA